MKIRVMTYNIMSCGNYLEILKNKASDERSLIDPLLSAAVIKKYEPDIVGLNEVHGKGGIYNEQAEQIARAAGYPYIYFAQAIMAYDSPYGNAILSKYPLVSCETIKIPDSDEIVKGISESRCIAKVTIDGSVK